MSKRVDAYIQFFLKTDEGKDFIKWLEKRVDTNHRKSEKEPELSRDYAQRAAGIREVIEHIQTNTVEVKK